MAINERKQENKKSEGIKQVKAQEVTTFLEDFDKEGFMKWVRKEKNVKTTTSKLCASNIEMMLKQGLYLESSDKYLKEMRRMEKK